MITWGINALNHGSSLAVFSGGELISNTFSPTDELPKELIYSGLNHGGPCKIYWYEQPWLKKARQLRAGQWSRAFNLDDLPRRYLKKANLGYAKLSPRTASRHAA